MKSESNSNLICRASLILSNSPLRPCWYAGIVGVLLGLTVVILWPASSQADAPTFDIRPWFGVNSKDPSSVAVGDVDGDGELDLSVYTRTSGTGLDEPLRVAWGGLYGDGAIAPLAVAGDAPLNLAWSAFRGESTFSVAWGDADGDGDLDLAVGSRWEPIRLYQNQGTVEGALRMTLVYTAPVADATRSVAWGDYDNDGDLDLAVGNGPEFAEDQYNRIYRNDGIVAGEIQMTLVWTASITDTTHSVAWGDYDGDGDLDLAVGNAGDYSTGCGCFLGDYSRLYRNDGVAAGVPQMTLAWTAPMTDTTRSVAWGDWNNDGDLDLAVGNAQRPNRVYRNVGGATPLELWWNAQVTDTTHSVAWGDYDGDGFLDLAVGNGHWTSAIGEPNRIFRNLGGTLTANSVYATPESEPTHSVAWGDYDGDGDLDLAMGNFRGPDQLYRNDGGGATPTFTLVWSTSLEEFTHSVAWGDLDGDGDLDLATGNSDAPNRLYRNEGTSLTSNVAWSSNELDVTWSVAWGDYDNDGDLDLAAGNNGQPNRVYRNLKGMLAEDAAWTAPITDNTTSVAWGDYDDDGDLDLAVGNYDQPNRLYQNVGGATLFTLDSWPVSDEKTYAIAWADYDNDGDLDLAVGNYNQQNHLYRNTGGAFETIPFWQSGERYDNTTSLTWGDVDNDGDLDLAVGNESDPVRLYRNDRGVLTTSAVWSSKPSERTMSVAWGDVDGDGDLDLAVGNNHEPNRLYRNDGGTLAASPVWSSLETDTTLSVAWGDYDGDGDLDLAAGSGFFGHPSRVYRNDDGVLTPGAVWSSPPVSGNYPRSVAWGDVDRDGDLDLAVGYGYDPYGDYSAGHSNRLYLNGRDARSGPGSIPVVSVRRPSPPGSADGYSSAVVWSGSMLSIPFTLSDPKSAPVKFIRAWYSPDGGGGWLPAVAGSGTVTTNLATNVTYVYPWDVFASGFLGQSDNVVFRIQAVPAIVNRPDTIPGPYLYGAYSSQTFPFRVRGTQVRVLSGTVPISKALVYRLPAGQSVDGALIIDDAGNPFRTDGQGYLQGQGEVGLGDRLLALLPITWTESYTVYYTSGTPTEVGLESFSVVGPGVQTLVVSADNPLYLFNLDVSLEWDAHNDGLFLEKLEYDLSRAAEYLYDYTDGQAGLGEVYVFQDAENWGTAHARVYATNRLRPNATLGGYIAGTLTDTLVPTLTYEAGQIRMPATWNRYGDPGGSVGEDWPRTLAHEFGHYYLFLDDHYLGLDEDGQVISIDTCIDTAMTDPYRYSEYRDQADWLPACEDTIANHLTGRSDWATIELFYAQLTGPDTQGTNAGPTLTPFKFTEITVFPPLTPTQTIPDPTFYFLTEGGQRYQPAEGTRGFLLKDDTWLLDVGEPVIDHILARGAKAGDRLCVFDTSSSRLGCETIQQGDDQMVLYGFPDWHPEIVVTPVTTDAIEVRVYAGESLSLQGRIFSTDGPATEIVDFTETVSGMYEAAMGSENVLLLEGFIQIWVDESAPRREMITDYSIGASPGAVRGHSGAVRGHSGAVRGHSGAVRGHGGAVRGHSVPILSGDGQVTIYTPDPTIPDGEFLTIQAATGVPELPPGRVQIGQAYRIAATEGITNLNESSISFQYLGDAVPGGMEEDITIYYWDENEARWHILATALNPVDNFASARMPGSGLYALLTAFRIPLVAPGWNLFSYPLRDSQPVSEALISIEGEYGIVYGYDATQSAWEAWDVYGVGVPEYVNDLEALEFGRGYWISVTQAITMYIGATGGQSELSAASLPPQVPATYYGQVLGGIGPGETVRAWVDGNLCGQGQTVAADDRTVYALNVLAEQGGLPGCGTAGRVITFQVGSVMMHQTVAWDDSRLWEVWLSESAMPFQVYLPSVLRGD